MSEDLDSPILLARKDLTEDMKQLMSMGFTKAQAEKALKQAGDVSGALDVLCGGSDAGSSDWSDF